MQQGPHYEDSTRQTVVKFLRQLVDPRGIWAVPEKMPAILETEPPPHNITKLHRFTGMAKQLAKFSPHLAEISEPLRELLSTKQSWVWGTDQQ